MLPRFVSSLSDSDAIDLFSPQRQFLECEISSYEPVFRLHSCLISHSKSRLESRHQHRCMHSILGVCKHQAFQPNLPTKHRFGYCKKRKRNLRSDSEARQITPTSQHGPKSRSRNGPLFVVATSNPNRKKKQPFLRKAHQKSNFDVAGASATTVPEQAKHESCARRRKTRS